MSGLLVTGTDTEVGKTIVCGHLLAYLRRRGWNVLTQKWVQTGATRDDDDLRTHLKIAGLTPDEVGDSLDLMRPYAFPVPASPHLSARLAGRAVSGEVIQRAFRRLCESYDLVLVEGVGGALVPLTEELILADVAAALQLPALVVVANRLGCINHTLLTVEALRGRHVPVMGLVFNLPGQGGNEEVLKDNPRIISALSGVPVLGEMPCVQQPLLATREFEPIGDEFLRHWERRGRTP